MTVYRQRQRLKYGAEQLFDLVADVERYPEFMPWVVESRVRERHNQTLVVDMTIAAGPLRKEFSTTGVLRRPNWIGVTSRDPIFDRFKQEWTFTPASEGATNVEYQHELQFRSRVLQLLMDAVFAKQATATMSAFKARAHRLYDRHA